MPRPTLRLRLILVNYLTNLAIGAASAVGGDKPTKSDGSGTDEVVSSDRAFLSCGDSVLAVNRTGKLEGYVAAGVMSGAAASDADDGPGQGKDDDFKGGVSTAATAADLGLRGDSGSIRGSGVDVDCGLSEHATSSSSRGCC